eukprot:5457023-Alexandrium_andersonii.AAC.1
MAPALLRNLKQRQRSSRRPASSGRTLSTFAASSWSARAIRARSKMSSTSSVASTSSSSAGSCTSSSWPGPRSTPSIRVSPCGVPSCPSRSRSASGSWATTSSVGSAPGASSTVLAPSPSRSGMWTSPPCAPTRRSPATSALRILRRAGPGDEPPATPATMSPRRARPRTSAIRRRKAGQPSSSSPTPRCPRSGPRSTPTGACAVAAPHPWALGRPRLREGGRGGQREPHGGAAERIRASASAAGP